MTTALDGDLKRELKIGKQLYTLTISPVGLKLTEKGKRKGFELAWKDIVTGEAALATALQASLGQFPKAFEAATKTPKKRSVNKR